MYTRLINVIRNPWYVNVRPGAHYYIDIRTTYPGGPDIAPDLPDVVPGTKRSTRRVEKRSGPVGPLQVCGSQTLLTHYPWGCDCRAAAMSESNLETSSLAIEAAS